MSGARELLDAHHKLDHESRNRGGRVFISNWYCEHPFADSVLSTGYSPTLTARELLPYYFQNDDHRLHAQIADFHESKGEGRLKTDNIFVTAGLSPLITAQILLLKRRGVKRIFYVRPLYYTYYFLAETLGIELVPLNSDPLLNDSIAVRLPHEHAQYLLLCDPVWYLGRNISHASIDAIRSWQLSTGGVVLVDGAFQYQRWTGNDQPEPTYRLVAKQTIRNMCPTKAVAVHGVRFAYAIVPPEWREELRYCYANTSGSGAAFDKSAASSIMRWLNGSNSNTPLLDYIHRRYDSLTRHSYIVDSIGAAASYFIFVSVPVPADQLITMDQRFFDATCYPGQVRLNLLLPTEDLVTYMQLAAAALGKEARPPAEYLHEIGPSSV
ncbi:MAG: hypothetical protein J2P37_36470 [Ktedonobacteraceae bacterium]|nr:hypothetical protein [Ktedonobacteraceae bacterium]